MVNNVHAQLHASRPRLAGRVRQNGDVASIFMALLSNLVHICNKRGSSLAELDISTPVIQAGQVKARLAMHAGTTQGLAYHSEFMDYAHAKAARYAKALEDNPRLGAFLDKLVGVIEAYAESKGVPFSSVKIEHGFIDRWDNLVLKLAA